MEEKKKKPADTFEKSLARLEKIVSEMESGSLSLDAMIERFEEGSALVKTCETRLDEVERKIEVLVKKGQALATEPFDPTRPDEKAG